MKKHIKAKILERSGGLCIYCGGSTPATSIDHMPPLVLFANKDRPRGLEYGACEPCNTGAAHSDLVVAMYARAFPDVPADQHDEVKAIFEGIRNNIPGFLEQMFVSEEVMSQRAAQIGAPAEQKFIAMDGPMSMSYLQAFGARMGMAFHFQGTGRIIPPEGGASVRIYSNIDLIDGTVPTRMWDILPPPATLSAGRKNVQDQFRYGVTVTEGEAMSMSFATFRQSFGLLVFTATDIAKLELPLDVDAARIVRPGHLRSI